jgi:hypothetical protein
MVASVAKAKDEVGTIPRFRGDEGRLAAWHSVAGPAPRWQAAGRRLG